MHVVSVAQGVAPFFLGRRITVLAYLIEHCAYDRVADLEIVKQVGKVTQERNLQRCEADVAVVKWENGHRIAAHLSRVLAHQHLDVRPKTVPVIPLVDEVSDRGAVYDGSVRALAKRRGLAVPVRAHVSDTYNL